MPDLTVKKIFEVINEKIDFFIKPLHENWLGTIEYHKKKEELESIKPYMEEIERIMNSLN